MVGRGSFFLFRETSREASPVAADPTSSVIGCLIARFPRIHYLNSFGEM